MQRGPAIGLIETNGVIAMVVAADVALKTSDVRLLGYQIVRNGLVTVMIYGNVDAVSIALEVAVREARTIGSVYHYSVLTRAEDETWDMLEKRNSFVLGGLKTPGSKPDTQSLNDVIDTIGVVSISPENKWNALNVEQLRRMVRTIPQSELTGRQISKANRKILLELLLRYYKEVELDDKN